MTLNRRALLTAASAIILAPARVLAQTLKPTTAVTADRGICIRRRGHVEYIDWGGFYSRTGTPRPPGGHVGFRYSAWQRICAGMSAKGYTLLESAQMAEADIARLRGLGRVWPTWPICGATVENPDS